MSVRLIFVSSVFAVIFGSGGNCVAAEPSYAPWAIISSGFNGAPHSIGYAPPTGGAGPGTVFAGGDLGGAYRSKTCGETWEHVNGGPPVSDGVNSGYSTAALICPCACNPANTSCADDPLCHHGVIYGGPPSVEPGSVDVRAFEAGPMPAVFAMLTAIAGLPAGPVVYRVGSRVWFALDGGLQWYPVPPTCIQGGNVLSHFEALGVDQDPGHAGHLVAASASGGAAFEASGCKGTNYQCATRQIAWTDDASFQMQASIDASDQSKSGAEYQIDRNSTWHFASLAHLATSNQPDNPSSCPAVPDVNLPGGACPVNNKLLCHGIKPTVADTAREDACLDLSTTNSKCFCADNPGCRYPAPTSVEIDPRNGWAYATTESGLLLSVDRGRSWGRNGLGNDPVPALRAEAAFDGLVHKQDGSTPQPPGDYPLPPSPVRLLTGMTSSQDADVPPAAWINDGNDVALDLNFAPWRIAHMGKMSLVFKALPGSPTN